VSGNLTILSGTMDDIKARMDEYEQSLHGDAEEYIKKGDYYMQMSGEQKDELFDESIVEFEKSLQMALKKLSIMRTKVGDMAVITKDFEASAGKLEVLYMKDIDQRKQYYLDHPNLIGQKNQAFGFTKPIVKGPNVDYEDIHRIFDEIEREESRSTIGILFSLSNIIMMTVIGFSTFLFLTVDGGHGKRLD